MPRGTTPLGVACIGVARPPTVEEREKAYPLGHVESLNDARTPLGEGASWRTRVGRVRREKSDCFSILLGLGGAKFMKPGKIYSSQPLNLFTGTDDRLRTDDSQRNDKTSLGLCVVGMLLVSAASATSVLAKPSGPVELPTDMGVLELLRAEVLDTVLLDRPVHFTTPQATDTVAQAGTYRV